MYLIFKSVKIFKSLELFYYNEMHVLYEITTIMPIKRIQTKSFKVQLLSSLMHKLPPNNKISLTHLKYDFFLQTMISFSV